MNPFPGLRPFRQDEDYLFFGREEQTMELLQRLGSNRFVAVVGTSGSGKSSLVRCALLSELQGGKLLRAGASWEIAVTHPGGNPFALLAEALLDSDLYDREEADARERLLATLSRSHFGLVEAVKQARIAEGTNFLLVVDQFEEIFRFNEAGQMQQEVANEFVSSLLAAVAQTAVPIYVVLTMRSDFIGDCGQFEGLAEMVNRGEFLIPRLTREQYKRVIEAPVKVAGGRIAPRLLQRLLNDLGQQSDQLPCLQHALMRSWDVASQRGGPVLLDLEDYQQIGKMSQALSLHADEVYASLASDRQRELCAAAFQALTVQESENRGIRRPQRLGNLSEILEVPAADLIPVIEAYRQHGVTFLTPPPEIELTQQTIIDISHESLMRVWNRLRHWVEEEYQAAGIYRRLSESATLYERGQAGLYRDPELAIALSWRALRHPNEAWAARYRPGFAGAMAFLDESQSAAKKADDERESARQRELEHARQLAEAQRLRAEEQKRAAARLRWLVAGLAGVAAIAIAAFFMAANARNKARENERLALQEQSRAVAAAHTAEVALENAKLARDQAERASAEEKRQRQVAETSRRQAEEDRRRAAEAERQAVADRKLAEHEKRLAESNAELARRREKLFEKLLPLLREHASEGVLQYARQLQADGQPLQALHTFADFCNLVLGEQQTGFHARDLLNLDALDVQGIDTEALAVAISVPPRSLYTDVLVPAIELGEQQLAERPDPELQQIVALLYTHRARLLQQHPNETWPGGESAAKQIFVSFDRASALDPQRFENFLGRAVARCRLPERDLAAALGDLNTALRLYPDAPEPPRDRVAVTDMHRRYAPIHHARATVLEYLALADRSGQTGERLRDAEQSHRRALLFDPKNPQYLVGLARTLRRQTTGTKTATLGNDQLSQAQKLLSEAIEQKPEFPDAYNELGEVYLDQARVADARKALETAVEFGKLAGKKRSLYTYYCNLANACTRDGADPTTLQRAVAAAAEALALDTDKPIDGHYYRGFAFWKLGQTTEALQALSNVVKLEPKHVEALLARSQIVFELKEPKLPAESLLQQAYADVRDVLSLPNLTGDEQAKAYYVNSLGWLRRHVTERSEDALVKCMNFAYKAARGSSAYVAFARQIFEHAAGVTWRDQKLQQESAKLQQKFRAALDAGETPNAD